MASDNLPISSFCLLLQPPLQIFVDNDVDGPLPYTGHLDARGIAAHLAMIERVSTAALIDTRFYISL